MVFFLPYHRKLAESVNFRWFLILSKCIDIWIITVNPSLVLIHLSLSKLLFFNWIYQILTSCNPWLLLNNIFLIKIYSCYWVRSSR
jgi:hypothetical protein